MTRLSIQRNYAAERELGETTVEWTEPSNDAITYGVRCTSFEGCVDRATTDGNVTVGRRSRRTLVFLQLHSLVFKLLLSFLFKVVQTSFAGVPPEGSICCSLFPGVIVDGALLQCSHQNIFIMFPLPTSRKPTSL